MPVFDKKIPAKRLGFSCTALNSSFIRSLRDILFLTATRRRGLHFDWSNTSAVKKTEEVINLVTRITTCYSGPVRPTHFLLHSVAFSFRKFGKEFSVSAHDQKSFSHRIALVSYGTILHAPEHLDTSSLLPQNLMALRDSNRSRQSLRAFFCTRSLETPNLLSVSQDTRPTVLFVTTPNHLKTIFRVIHKYVKKEIQIVRYTRCRNFNGYAIQFYSL